MIDGRGGAPRAALTVVIRDGRIANVLSGKSRLPPGATIMDLTGQYLMPGLVDSHVHLPRNRHELEKHLRFLFGGGITAVRDMGGNAALYSQLAPRSREASSPLPRLYYSAYWAGPSFWAADKRWKGATQDKPRGEVPWALAVTEHTDLAAAVASARKIGATAIKIYSDLSPQLIRSIAAEAHRQGLTVWSHPAVFPVRPADVAPSGIDVISHSRALCLGGSRYPPEPIPHKALDGLRSHRSLRRRAAYVARDHACVRGDEAPRHHT